MREYASAGPALVACSGGADSLALAAAAAFVLPRLGHPVGMITVDHGLQPGSADRAADVVTWARKAGFDPAEVVTVDVTGPGGPEAAARDARYQALVAAAHQHGAGTVLLGHTRDDQAETVLLALARGAGPRGLSGMPPARTVGGVTLLRPFMAVSRAQTRAACTAADLRPWDDPHNVDPAYARARVRAGLLPALVETLGMGVVDNLARTAAMIAADAALLDRLAAGALEASRATPSPAGSATSSGRACRSDTSTAHAESSPGPAASRPDLTPSPSADVASRERVPLLAGVGLSAGVLTGLDPAIRTRVLHAWCRELGAAGTALSHRHVAALDALVVGWHGQGTVSLPGGIGVARRGDFLVRVDPAERAL